MKWIIALLSASTAAAHPLSARGNGSTSHGKSASSLGLPSDGLTTNGVAFGFLPSQAYADVTYTMADINKKLGLASASTYGWYSQIDSLPYNDDQLTGILDDLKSSGAVFQPAVMPILKEGFSAITSSVGTQIADAMKSFTDEGIEVWLRFGHEMNWYASSEGGNTYTGTSDEFITAWKNVWTAVQGNNKVKMYWSPNTASLSNISPWWPGEKYVDIVGVDCYPSGSISSSQFDTCYKSVYDAYSTPYNLPFAIGETGADADVKETWLAQLVGQDMSDWPNYVSASWFEYDKESDFRIVETDATTLAKTKATLGGSGGSSGSGGSGTTTTIAASSTGTSAACDWGCYGWDCSDNQPCQSSYTCKSGYCKS